MIDPQEKADLDNDAAWLEERRKSDSRAGMQLTAAAQEDRDQFEAKFGDRGNCSCHLHPPCGSCVHPGNPNNQDEDDECWEPEPKS